MVAQVIDGAKVAQATRAHVAVRASDYTARYGNCPGLATVLVGDDPASQVYVNTKRKLAASVGIADFHTHLSARSSQSEVEDCLAGYAEHPGVSGILLQLPLPAHLDATALIDTIPVAKDVDGLTSGSKGLLSRSLPGLRPCTPAGIMALLDAYGLDLDGATAVVVGRSDLVGKPVAQMLLDRNATVTVAHSRTKKLAEVTLQADLLVVAAGRPGLVGGDMVSPGTTVVDVGIHRTSAGLVGDVAADQVKQIAARLTPVPGGVGPMTIAMLLQNTVLAAERLADGN